MPHQPSPPEVCLILSTFEREEDATAIVRTLLAERLIACGTINRGARSIYVWENEIHDTQELLVIFKTSPDQAAAAAARLAALHPYEVPEILTLAAAAADSYANWVTASSASNLQQ